MTLGQESSLSEPRPTDESIVMFSPLRSKTFAPTAATNEYTGEHATDAPLDEPDFIYVAK